MSGSGKPHTVAQGDLSPVQCVFSLSSLLQRIRVKVKVIELNAVDGRALSDSLSGRQCC